MRRVDKAERFAPKQRQGLQRNKNFIAALLDQKLCFDLTIVLPTYERERRSYVRALHHRDLVAGVACCTRL